MSTSTFYRPQPGRYGGSAAAPAAGQAERLRDAEDKLKKIADEPLLVATVVEVRGGRMLISMGPGNALDVHAIKGVQVGQRVLVTRNTMQATATIEEDGVPTGIIVTVERAQDDFVEGTLLGTLKTFRAPPGAEIRKGERVIVDPSMTFVIGSLGMPPSAFSIAAKVSVSWSDVGGQEDAKEALREAIELPLVNPKLFAAYGKRSVKGVLLWGPPGTGKTILAKASATSIAKAHGETTAAGFVYVKGPELISSYIGKSEQAVRDLFAAAREHKTQHGYPCVIFIDECDALLGARDRGPNVSLNATVVPQFLAEMDGLEDSAAIFILATNRPDMLDPAVVREGRVDRKIKVARPTREDARLIFDIHLRGRPLGAGDAHVERAIEAMYADERVVRKDVGPEPILLRHLASGAMIAGVVERATTRAIRRDLAASSKKPTGITADDLIWAVDRAVDSLGDTNLGEIVRELREARDR